MVIKKTSIIIVLIKIMRSNRTRDGKMRMMGVKMKTFADTHTHAATGTATINIIDFLLAIFKCLKSSTKFEI